MNIDSTTRLNLQFDARGLIPVAVQDYQSLELLMIAFANQAAIDRTLETGLATFFRRSEQKLWTKGLTSGDLLKVREIRVNCYQSSLLYIVEKVGRGVCHAKDPEGNNYPTCFYRRINRNQLEFV